MNYFIIGSIFVNDGLDEWTKTFLVNRYCVVQTQREYTEKLY